MKHVFQRGGSDCGVAAFAMLTDRSYEDARETLGREIDIPDITLRVLLQRDGWFIRDIDRRSETGGAWPPPPFAQRHYAIVTQPSGNGHYVVMEEDGRVLDPLTDTPRRLDEWTVCSNVCGMVRRPTGSTSLARWYADTRTSGAEGAPITIDHDWPAPLAEGGYIHCGCSCHLPIGSGSKAECDTCIHCRLIA